MVIAAEPHLFIPLNPMRFRDASAVRYALSSPSLVHSLVYYRAIDQGITSPLLHICCRRNTIYTTDGLKIRDTYPAFPSASTSQTP